MENNYPIDINLLLDGSTYLAAEECVDGKAYWVRAHSIGSVALCKRDSAESLVFTGLREKLGEHFLFDELHFDDGREGFFPGTLRPLCEIGDSPELEGIELIAWFVGHQISVAMSEIVQLEKLKDTHEDPELIGMMIEDRTHLIEALNDYKQRNYTDLPVTFKSILEQARNNKTN